MDYTIVHYKWREWEALAYAGAKACLEYLGFPVSDLEFDDPDLACRGLVIDKETHMGHLKGTLMDFIAAFFETDQVEAQFRPHHFPFTEPSFELEIYYNGDWMEVLGCGVVHSGVLSNCGLQHRHGWAFGLGLERLAMVTAPLLSSFGLLSPPILP